MSFLLFAESETVAAGDGAAPVAVCTGDPAADAGRALLGAASEAARAGVHPAVCVVLSRAVAERTLLQPIAAAGAAGAEGGTVAVLPDAAVGFPGGGTVCRCRCRRCGYSRQTGRQAMLQRAPQQRSGTASKQVALWKMPSLVYERYGDVLRAGGGSPAYSLPMSATSRTK